MDEPSHYARERAAMVENQLRPRGIDDERVLAAMRRTPREWFMPERLAHDAYADCASSISCGQTISQPLIVAMMTQALRLTPSNRVLEVGAGSGYQTAILAQLCAEVVAIERHETLSLQAQTVLARLGYGNIHAIVADGTLGFPPLAPYDRILIAAAALQTPIPLFQQLAEGGLLVIPLGQNDGEQTLEVIQKVRGQMLRQSLGSCRFVPLVDPDGRQV